MKELWLNYAPNTGQPAYQQQTKSGGFIPTPYVPSFPTIPTTQTGNTKSGGFATPALPSYPTLPAVPATKGGNNTIICNKCQNGYAVGNQFTGSTCPIGWTTDKDPCLTSVIHAPLQVDCHQCNGEYQVMNRFDNSCPSGWYPQVQDCSRLVNDYREEIDEIIPNYDYRPIPVETDPYQTPILLEPEDEGLMTKENMKYAIIGLAILLILKK